MSDTIPYYIDQLLGFLTSPWSAVLLIVGIGIALVLMNVPSARWWVVSFLLYSTTFGVTGLGAATENAFATGTEAMQRLAFPLSVVQTNARMLSIICLIFMLLPSMSAPRGRRISLVTGPFLGLFALEIWVCIRLSLGMATARSSLDLVVVLLMLATLTVGVGRWLQTPQDARALLKSFAGFGILFILGNLYQFVMVPSTLHQVRLSGTTPSPQAVGQLSAIIIIPTLFLAQDKLVTRRWRFTSVVVAGAMALLLLWSGSRTGMLMTLLGILVLFGARLHRFILPAIGLLVALWLGSLLFPMAFNGVTRFTDTSNDRAGAWSWMIDQYIANPVVGITSSGMGYRESFFLATLAYYGSIGAVPMLLMVVLTIGSLFKLFRHRKLMGPNAGLLRVLTAMFALLAVAAMFEASLLGLLNGVTFAVYLAFALLAFCRDEVLLNQYAGGFEADPYTAAAYGDAPAFTDLSWY